MVVEPRRRLLSRCRHGPCRNGGLCYEGLRGDVKCVCRGGFTGPRCRDRPDPCTSQPCLHDGYCRPRRRGRRPNGLRSRRPKRSHHRRRRKHSGDSRRRRRRPYRCICVHGFRGAYCQIGPGPCASNPCGDGTVCKAVVGGKGYSCKTRFHFPILAEIFCLDRNSCAAYFTPKNQFGLTCLELQCSSLFTGWWQILTEISMSNFKSCLYKWI